MNEEGTVRTVMGFTVEGYRDYVRSLDDAALRRLLVQSEERYVAATGSAKRFYGEVLVDVQTVAAERGLIVRVDRESDA